MNRRRIALWALAMLLLFAVAGCTAGGQEDSTPSPNFEPSPTQTAPALTPKNRVDELLAAMTVEEKVGQMFLARCPEVGGGAFAERYALGGYVLFGRDFKDCTPQQVRERVASYQAAAKVPMLIAVDEEGGTVVRVSRYPAFRPEPFQAPREVYANGGLDALRADAAEKSELLLSLGINVNLAPVCDLSDNSSDFIYDRSLGGDGETVGECVSAIVETMNKKEIGSVLKHFPGYGNNADTHTGIAYDRRALETFEQADFVPFRAGIEAGAGGVLVSHNIVFAMDDALPASLSPEVHRILREELGFDGVVITDDLAMDAIGQFTDGETAAVLAVEAGNDLLCCSDVETQYPAVLEAVQSGRITEERLDESVRRVLLWKLKLGLLEQ
ncbi:MAG: beta-hexosaminidase [Oscillospiraceae bacterium]|nr:beta-hexosaminidase [Oscillospiraceae bacterium]